MKRPVMIICSARPGTGSDDSDDDGNITWGRPPKPQPSKKQCTRSTDTKPEKTWRNRDSVNPPFELNTIDDLLYIAWNYQGTQIKRETLWELIPHLIELNSLIGMEKLKQGVIDMIVYFLQDLHLGDSEDKAPDGDLLHTVLYGPPGTGKTTVAHILAKIYCKLGFLSTDNVVVVKRSDLIGKYVGHSEAQTRELLESARGGVFLLDEAYSLGNGDRTDSFSKAIVDLINQFLSENKRDLICIIAGYKKELEENFFGLNPGLSRRFPWRFSLEGYSSEELARMFERKVQFEEWNLSAKQEDIVDFFEKNMELFPAFGGDVEVLFTFCKTTHSRRVFGSEESKKRKLTFEDIEMASKKMKNKNQEKDKPPSSLYC